MCSLLVLLGADQDFPILVGANRDEQRSRASSPPGLFTGSRRRILAPRDHRAGGTWMAVNEALWFAAVTNVAGGNRFAEAASRGRLPSLALDQARFADVEPALAGEVAARTYNDFQLLVTDGERTLLLRHVDRVLHREPIDQQSITLNNEQTGHDLVLPEMAAARAPGLTVRERLDVLAGALVDRDDHGGHRMLKTGGDYGTVSSSLLAVPRSDPRRLLWRYAAGPPDTTPYREYGNLARRLVED